MNYLKTNNLKDYDINFSEPYKYNNNKYKFNCLIKTLDIDYYKNIIIKTSKLQLQSNINSGYIVVQINNNNDKQTNFINFIKTIEEQAQIYLKNKLKKKFKTYTNFIGENKDLKYIFKTNNIKNLSIFDKNKNKITSNNVEIYSDIILLIKLQNLWLDTEKKQYGLNWLIYQCRIYPEIDYNKCLIYDSESEEEEIKNEIIVQKCVFCNSTCIYKNTINNINIGKGKGSGKGGKGIGNKGSSGKGNIITESKSTGRGIDKSKEKPNEKSKTESIGTLVPTTDELINIRNKLKKMVKNEDSD